MTRLVFDIETTYEHDLIHCISIMDRDSGELTHYPPDAVEEGVRRLAEADELYAHNGVMFDKPVVERLYEVKLPPVRDTLIWSRICYPDRFAHPCGGKFPNSIEAWGRYLKMPKHDCSDFSVYTADMGTYCDQDVRICERIATRLEPKVADMEFAVRLEHRVAKLIAEQIAVGVGFDSEACQELRQRLITEQAEAEDELHRVFPPHVVEMKKRWWVPAPGFDHIPGEKYATLSDAQRQGWTRDQLVPGPYWTKEIPFNPGSGQQIVERLQEKRGWRPTEFTDPSDTYPKGQPKMDEQVMAKLPWPEVRLLEKWLDLKKKLEFTDSWLQFEKNGRIHGKVTTIGCVSSRMSHSQPNLGQVPRKIEGGGDFRKCFIAAPGSVLIGCDLAGIELRCLANRMWPWDNGAYSRILLEADIHTANQKAAGLDSRDDAKTFIYALIYGAGDGRLGEIVHGSLQDGRRLRAQFFAEFPAIEALISHLKRSAKKNKGIRGIDGRLIPVRSPHMALNTQLQSDAAIIAKVWFALAMKEVENEPYRNVLNVHDELQGECWEPDEAPRIGQTIVDQMAVAGQMLGMKVPVTGEYKIGKNWSETH